jgi:putative ABC transport system permease protein
MNQAFRIAVRNVGRQRKRTILLSGAVAFGFFVITLVDGFTGGIVSAVQDNFSRALGGHLYLTGSVVSERDSEVNTITDDTAAIQALESIKDKIASVHRRSSGRGTVYFGTKERSQQIEGVDFTDERDFAEKLEIDAGALGGLGKADSLVLPSETARKLGVAVGESVIIKIPTVTGQLNVGEFVLIATTPDSGIFGSGRAYVGKTALNELIGLPPEGFQTINVYLDDVEDTGKASSALYAELARRGPVAERDNAQDHGAMKTQMQRIMGRVSLNSVTASERWTGTKFTLTTIEDIMAPILALVSTLNMISLGVFIVLLSIIMIGILNSYRMVMIERTTEIGTMRAIGVRKNTIRDIFLWEALTISAVGAVSGFFLGIAAIGIISLFEFGGASFFSVFLSKGHLGFAVSPLESLRNLGILCLMSLAAVYGPARTASRMDPAQALRTSY